MKKTRFSSSKYTNFYLYDDKFAIVCQINNTKKGTAGRAGGFERMTATVVFFAVTVEHELSTLAKIRIAFCFVEISCSITF